ncbi:uncharacterized protein LOC126898684 isoform X3 [Daktulosphaira vitifoliae]|uniref:uncharacterized protein LOC126898684 isoform X1 n=1 Tax=Daktulosphaira vitifoliae TaxID=58002 RepID=UPI0021A9C0A4|nr:uncharacterized protein LOC126898684 isoform X1 [Daktulosphaira vitifoliae]XP_050528925.1 uncharacterized protein LOC126898684 isoform X2 [Daktulosphaira vitifoliae]XP_050528926.1 uncharacterized protein LOC126898684 isoform X3 [Daktulosphaira vitifoliae]
MDEIKYKYEVVMIVSGLFMLLTMYELPVNSYFESYVYFRNFQDVIIQLTMPLILQIIVQSSSDAMSTHPLKLFWLLDIIEYLMYFTTFYLVRRIVYLLYSIY